MTVIVLLLLGWAIDTGARAAAQSVVAGTIQQSQQLKDKPTVAVRGWFFLAQAVRGRYDDVDVTLHGLHQGPLHLSTVTAHLRGVQVPLKSVLSGRVSRIAVDQSAEVVTLTYADLNAYLKSQGKDVTVSAGPPGELKVTGQLNLFGQSVALSADAVVRPGSGELQITPTQLDTGTALDGVSRDLVNKRFTFAISTAPFPFGQRVTSIEPTANALTVQASGSDVVLSATS
ncbi:DUF2993 domain-containing protein [Dermatophilaceae bacterium Sec6.4]